MVSKELIEKVAQEICKGLCGESWEGVYPHRIDSYRNSAKAAISTILAALQEPTEGMRERGLWYSDDPEKAWRAMLSRSPLGEQRE